VLSPGRRARGQAPAQGGRGDRHRGGLLGGAAGAIAENQKENQVRAGSTLDQRIPLALQRQWDALLQATPRE
jgi:hypothetical protein